MSKLRIALWVGFVSSLISTIIFGLLLFSDIFDTEEYVLYHKTHELSKSTNAARAYGALTNAHIESGIVTLKTNKIKANVFKVLHPDREHIIEPNYKYHTFSGCSLPPAPPIPCPSQPSPIPTQPPKQGGIVPQQEDWGRKQLQASEAWSKTKGESITICILDTGIDKSHPDLTYVDGQDFTGGGDFQDSFGHGSHVAGIIAAIDNGYDVVGTSQAKLLIGKVLGEGGSGGIDSISQGIIWCTNKRAKIISMSLGSPQYSEIINQSLQEAIKNGIVVIAAAGNDGGPTNYPAAIQGVVAVGATDPFGRLTSFSSRGKIETCAPGLDIVSTVPMGSYELKTHVGTSEVGKMSGTSMATPYVSAVVALALASGKNVGFTQGDAGCGNGIVNALKTVNQ